MPKTQVEEAIGARISSVTDQISKHPRIPLWTVDGDLSIYAAVLVTSGHTQNRPYVAT